MKINYISMVMNILLILFSILVFDNISSSNDVTNKNYLLMTIRHWQYFDSSKRSIITDEKEGISSGDFRFESTGYRYGSIGSINGNFLISMTPYKDVTVSRLKKIQNADFDSISRLTCSKAKYDRSSEQILQVNDGDVLCLALDKNRDGAFGDNYLKIKIISHTDSNEGNYADTIMFIYKVL